MKELFFIRNFLLQALEDETIKSNFLLEFKSIFNDAIKAVQEKQPTSFQNLSIWCLNNAVEFIQKKDFENALIELQLIHNLPSIDDYKDWYQRWFYAVQVPEYISKVNEAEKIKQFIKLLSVLD